MKCSTVGIFLCKFDKVIFCYFLMKYNLTFLTQPLSNIYLKPEFCRNDVSPSPSSPLLSVNALEDDEAVFGLASSKRRLWRIPTEQWKRQVSWRTLKGHLEKNQVWRTEHNKIKTNANQKWICWPLNAL